MFIQRFFTTESAQKTLGKHVKKHTKTNKQAPPPTITTTKALWAFMRVRVGLAVNKLDQLNCQS